MTGVDSLQLEHYGATVEDLEPEQPGPELADFAAGLSEPSLLRWPEIALP